MRNMQPKWRTVFALAAVLLALAPAGAFAGAKTDFSAIAVMTESAGWDINTGDVPAAGASGRFVVKDRTVTGVFTDGDLIGLPFSFTYGSNVPLLTQSGQFHGTLTAGAYTIEVRGSSKLSGPPALACCTSELFLDGSPKYPAVVIQLELTGGFTFTDGAQGHGSLNGVFTVAINPVPGPEYGHILFLVPSGLQLFDLTTALTTGKLVPIDVSTITSVSLSGSWSN